MEITVSNLPKSEVKIVIKLSDKKTEELKNITLKELAKSVNVTGFRAGHAPLDVVENQLGKDKVLAMTLDQHLPTLYADAIKKEKLTPISRPTVDIVAESPLEFSAQFAVQPEVKIKDVDKIKIKAPKIEVSKKELDEVIDRLKKSGAEFEQVSRKTKTGDRVEIDFEGFDEEEKLIPGTKSENHPVVIGDKMFIPGFEENLVGFKENDTTEFTVTFPKDYHVDTLKNKPVKFKVTIKKVEESKLPEINEEFSQKVFGEPLDEKAFHTKLKFELEHQKIHDSEAQQEDELFNTLIKNSDFDVSDILTEEETEILLDEMKQNVEKNKLNFEDFVKMTEQREKMSINDFYKPKAEERVKIRFIIDHIIRTKKLEATPDDFKKEIAQKVKSAPAEVQGQVTTYYQEGNPGYAAIKNQILLGKFFELFIERIPHKH